MKTVIPDRRATLSLGIAAAAASSARPASAAGTTPGANAKLIRLCAEFDAVERRGKSYYAGGAT
jgi:predicted secreted protein